MRHLLFFPVTVLIAAAPAIASTDDAWAAMHADIKDKCIALAPPGASHKIEINPFGSERFGAAIVTTTMQDGSAERAICIYEKQSQTAEMTAPFGADE